MPIYSYCGKCRSSGPVRARVCPSCADPYPRRNRKYRVNVSRKGKRYNRIVEGLANARDLESALKTDVVRGDFEMREKAAGRTVPTLAAFWDNAYLPHIRTAKKTWKNDEYLFERHIRPRFGRKRLNEIGAAELERMKAELSGTKGRSGSPLAPATVRHCMVIVRRVFNVAIKWQVFDGPNPVQFVDMPSVDNQQTEFLTPEETARLWKTLEEWPAPETSSLVKFAMLTGFRRGEIFRLKWEDVDEARAAVTLREPKGGKTSVVPISGAALEVLRNHREVTGGDSSFVFPGQGGAMRTTVQKVWERMRKKAGLPGLRFHALRHNYASQLVSSGTPLEVVRELLTHKDFHTTLKYAHLAPGPVRDAAERSGDLLKPGPPDPGEPPQGTDPKPEAPSKVIPFPRRKNGTTDDE